MRYFFSFLFIVAVVGAIAYGYYGYFGLQQQSLETADSALNAGKAAAAQIELHQVLVALNLFYASNDRLPQDLEELKAAGNMTGGTEALSYSVTDPTTVLICIVTRSGQLTSTSSCQHYVPQSAR